MKKLNDVTILLVEDNKADSDLVKEVVEEKSLGRLKVVDNGEDALMFLRQEGRFSKEKRPDYVLLDLNLPKVDGRDVLRSIKTDENLKIIPIIVLTSSEADQDIATSYELNANCYVKKPGNFEEFEYVLESLMQYWAKIARLPGNLEGNAS